AIRGCAAGFTSRRRQHKHQLNPDVARRGIRCPAFFSFADAAIIAAKKLRHSDEISLVYWHNIYQSPASSCRLIEAAKGGKMTDTVQGAAPIEAARVSDAYRWTQLTIGVLAMVMIANYQYGWTFFVPDIQKKFGWDRASIQW